MSNLGNTDFEAMASTINDLCDDLPKGRGACFDIGSNGGCGADCAEFCRGGCDEPQEICKQDVIDAHGEDAACILSLYDCFGDEDER